MNVTKVRFDEQMFLLDPRSDVEETKQAIILAARDGSDFVDFHTVGHGTISLLVTPNLAVRFEVVERTQEELDELEADPPPLDPRSSNGYDYEF